MLPPKYATEYDRTMADLFIIRVHETSFSNALAGCPTRLFIQRIPGKLP